MKKNKVQKTAERRVSVGGVLFIADLPIVSSASGEYEGWLDETVAAHDIAIALWLIEHGACSGDALRWIRKAIGMKANELAQNLGVTAETVSRWENAHMDVDPTAWVLLGAMVRDQAAGETRTVDALRLARERPRLPDTAVRLEVA